MKKITAMVLVFVMCMAIFTGCQKKDPAEGNNTNETAGSQSNEAGSTGSLETENEEGNSNTSQTLDDTKDSTTDSSEKININIAALKGPTSMGMVKLMEDSESGKTANNYTFKIAGAADEITAGIIKGDYDIAAIPSNLAAVLYNKSKGGLVTAGINTLGVLYILETGDSIHSITDLKGKTIYSTGKGTTPEYTLNYLLNANGLDPDKDVTVEYKSEATEVAAVLKDADDAVAMLPQPFVTTVMMNNKKLRIAIDVAKEWEKVSDNGSTVVTGVVVINKKFLDSNKAAVDAFLAEYKASADFVNKNSEEASALIEKYDIFKAAVALKAIPYCNITFLEGDEMKTKIGGYLETLLKQNPETVGGTLPDDAFYYKK